MYTKNNLKPNQYITIIKGPKPSKIKVNIFNSLTVEISKYINIILKLNWEIE